MKKIRLTQGFEAIVDDRDFSDLNQWNWCAADDGHGFIYAVRKADGQRVYMSRLIMGARIDQNVIHRNLQTLDNRRQNLRKVKKPRGSKEEQTNKGKN